MNVLFISVWYPHRYDSMSGLFVQKHAEAANLYANVQVLYVHADENIREFEITEQIHNNLNEVIVYFPDRSTNIFRKIIKTYNYVKAYWKGYKYITKKGFSPDLLHVNTLTRTGFMAYIYKKWKGTPYVITEHWSRYFSERPDSNYKGFLRKRLTKKIVKNASAVMPVSLLLQNAMLQHRLNNPNYIIVDNVVDDFFFEKVLVAPRNKKRILHISCFLEKAKNVSGILNATKELLKQRDDFELVIIGTGIDFDETVCHAQQLDFPENSIHFIGERTPLEVSEWLQNSDFFILFSNYETAGVVILESMATGKPVVCTDVGIAPQYIKEDVGIVIPVGDETELCNQMNYMLDHFQEYDAEKIRKYAFENFSYKNVGKKLSSIYSDVLKQ